MTQEKASLDNGFIRLEYLTQAGPRITGLYLGISEENLMAELPDAGWDTPFGPFRMYGGHRLWTSPEAKPRTSLPDNEPPQIEEIPGGVRLTQNGPDASGIQKIIEVTLPEGSASVTVHHRLRNDGWWPVELASWGITQLKIGGTAILPQIPPDPDPANLLPNRQLVLWPYTRLTDPRLVLGDEEILIRTNAGDQGSSSPVKIGYANIQGWLAYLLSPFLFVKRFPYHPENTYPDMGCNAEVFANPKFIEIESLGPLTILQPGESVEHTETWEVLHTTDLPFRLASGSEGFRELSTYLSRP